MLMQIFAFKKIEYLLTIIRNCAGVSCWARGKFGLICGKTRRRPPEWTVEGRGHALEAEGLRVGTVAGHDAFVAVLEREARPTMRRA